jgi:hypothetical protein
MDSTEIFQILVNASKALRTAADGDLNPIFQDDSCLVLENGDRQFVISWTGDVFIQSRWKGKKRGFSKLEGNEGVRCKTPERESVSRDPNAYNNKWLRGAKSELERVNSLESLLFPCNSKIL